MFNFFNSPMLNSLRRTFRPPTLVTGGDGSPNPFPLPLPGGLPEPDAVFGAEPSTPPVAPPPIVAQPEPLKFTTPPGDGVPPKPLPLPSFDTAAPSIMPANAVSRQPNEATAAEPSRVPSVIAPLGKKAEQTPRELRKATDDPGIGGIAKALQQGGQPASAETRIRTPGETIRAREADAEKAAAEAQKVARKIAIGDGDREFVSHFEGTLEDQLRRAPEMSPIEAREFSDRLERAKILGLNPKKARRASKIFLSIRSEGLSPNNVEFFPTTAIAEKLKRLEDGFVSKILPGVVGGLAVKALGAPGFFLDAAKANMIDGLRKELYKRRDADDEEARQALERKDRAE